MVTIPNYFYYPILTTTEVPLDKVSNAEENLFQFHKVHLTVLLKQCYFLFSYHDNNTLSVKDNRING